MGYGGSREGVDLGRKREDLGGVILARRIDARLGPRGRSRPALGSSRGPKTYSTLRRIRRIALPGVLSRWPYPRHGGQVGERSPVGSPLRTGAPYSGRPSLPGQRPEVFTRRPIAGRLLARRGRPALPIALAHHRFMTIRGTVRDCW